MQLRIGAPGADDHPAINGFHEEGHAMPHVHDETHASTNHAAAGASPGADRKGGAEAPSESELGAAFRGRPHAFLDAGQARLAYWRFGAGPDVVFIHGWPLHAATFRRVVPLLADSFTCHLVDLPGAGQTECHRPEMIDLVAHAKTVRRAIDGLGLGRYAMLAHDSGGFVARAVAADDARVTGLVLGNTEIPGHTPWLVAMYALLAKAPGGTAAMRALMKIAAVRRSSLGFGGCFEDPGYVDGDFRAFFVDPLVSPGQASDGAMRLLQNVHGDTLGGLAEAHARIKVPVQLVWGRGDPFFPIDKARAMLGQFGGRAELQEIPRAKLFAHEDHPVAFCSHAKPFLRACFGG
jgi:haloalkane dehalogenase